MLANLLRQPGLSRLVKRPLNLKLEVRNCQVNFQNYLHLSASGRGDLKDLVEKPVKPKQASKFPGFDPVFLSPHIGTIRFFTRLKLYQSALVLAVFPFSLQLLRTEQILPNQVGIVAGFAGLTLVVLGLVGEYFRKFVGILYLSEDRSQVIVSHNTFFGKRKDVTIDVENIMPIADTPENVNDLVWKIRLYQGDPKSFYICTRAGGILSRKGFREIFGEDSFEKK